MHQAPICPGDGLRMVSTVVGWRCPICGLALLPSSGIDPVDAVAARPYSTHR